MSKLKELLHYVVVYAIIRLATVFFMPATPFYSDLDLPLLVVFIVADQLAHKIILHEEFSLW